MWEDLSMSEALWVLDEQIVLTLLLLLDKAAFICIVLEEMTQTAAYAPAVGIKMD